MTIVQKLTGANMDIDWRQPGSIAWQQDCVLEQAEGSAAHHWRLKTSPFAVFCGVEYIDTLLCCYPNPSNSSKSSRHLPHPRL